MITWILSYDSFMLTESVILFHNITFEINYCFFLFLFYKLFILKCHKWFSVSNISEREFMALFYYRIFHCQFCLINTDSIFS